MSGRLRAIGIFVITSIILSVVIWGLRSYLTQTFVDIRQVETGVFDLINEERVNRGLPLLLEDTSLATIALKWSEHLAETGDLTHGNFEDRIAGIGYSQYSCGEVIAMYDGWTASLERQFVDMWLGSEGHYEIMMTPRSGYMGVGVFKGGQGFFAVVDFRFVES